MYIICNLKDEYITQISVLLNQLSYKQNIEQFIQNCLKSRIYHCLVAEKETKIIKKIEVIAKEKKLQFCFTNIKYATRKKSS